MKYFAQKSENYTFCWAKQHRSISATAPFRRKFTPLRRIGFFEEMPCREYAKQKQDLEKLVYYRLPDS